MMKKHGGTMVVLGILAAVGAVWLWARTPAPPVGPPPAKAGA